MSVQFIIDPLQAVKPISPYIYGINQALAGYSNYTYERLGGDLTTDWNWENGDSNAGIDYYYQNESLSYSTGGSNAPGGAAIPVLNSDFAQNAATLLTVPINGYVAANTANDNVLSDPVTTVTSPVSSTATVIPVANAAAIPSTPYYIVIDSEEMEVTSVNLTQNDLTVVRGISGGTATPQANDPVYLSPDVRNSGANYLQTQFEQELPLKPGAPGSFTLTPTPGGPVYADEFVNWVNTMYPYGQTSTTTPIWFELDNEPDLWASTHTEIQPTPVTYAEVLQDSIEYSEAIKSVEPKALVFGPSSYGWEGYISLQDAPDAAGRDWLDYYLQQMQQASVSAGERLLDVLDVHFYTSTPDDPADVVQAPRSLWDPNYMENSWIAQSIPGPIELLPRLQADINQYYPGTKLSISEYNYGDGDEIDGAIAEADALGIFGVQGVYAASVWNLPYNDPDTYIGAALNMYRDFDGNDGTFGDTSVMASTNDVTDSSIYASVDSANTNVMTLVAINKSTQPLTATMQLNHVQPGATAAIYQLTSASTTPQYVGTVTISNPANFTYTMPGYSVTTIRIVSPSGQGNAPTVATAAMASPSSVTGVSTKLSVLGADANGEPNLTYTWITTTAPGPVTFSVNGTNAAQDTVATFREAGTYSFLVTITNADDYFATSSVKVTVDATLTNITVTPVDPTTAVNGEQQFTASSTDQFGNALSTLPSYTWSASAGAMTSAGVFTAPASAGRITVTASAAGARGSTVVSVVSPTTITVSAATDAALRSAITSANTDAANGDAVTILFAASLAGDTIDLSSGPLELKAGTGAIRIEGGGLIALSGDGNSQVFQIDSGAQATLDGLTIEDGNAGSGSGGGIGNAGTLIITNTTLADNTAGTSGGAIDNTGSLTATNITLTGNSAGANGGGIDNEQAGTLSVTNATFSGNSAPTGGGIDNAGTVMILDATFNENNAGGTSGTGGGIGNTGELTLINATLTDNSASSVAGGIYNAGLLTVTGSTIDDNTGSYIAGGINNVGTMTVTNCTLAGNYAYLGGGIYNGNYYGQSGNLTLSNDTITSNFADYGAGGGIYMANGTYSTTGGSTLTLFDTLVAGNYASGNSSDPLSNPVLPFGPDIQVYSGTVSGSYNLIGDGQGLTGISNGDANHNQVGTPTAPINPLLAAPIVNVDFTQTLTSPVVAFNQSEIPLTNNGGPTQTIALVNGSPAIGAGGAVTAVTGPIVGANSIPVADAAGIASTSGQYFILIDGEEMEVTNVNLATNVLTVVRAINGVTATLHSNDPVYLYDDQRGVTRAVPSDIGAYQYTASSLATATFLGKDTATEGSWIGVYGSQGYNIINATNGVDYPSYATVTTAGNTPYTWAANTNVVQALQDPSGPGRIAAAWYASSSFTVDVDLTDGQAHDIELYLLDYDSTSRSEQIVFTNANTHAVLSTQTVSSFHSGVYLNYTVSGNVLITFTKTGGANAVLSGLFFDPSTTTSVSTSTSVGSSLNPSTTGQSVTFTATVSDTSGGVPTGSVTFYDGSTDLGPGSTLSGSGNSATSTLTTSALTAGSHSIRAVYTPTGNFASSSGSLTQTVNNPSATATYNGKDTTTEGSWIGVYGSQGYNVINAANGVDYPSYATVTTAGNTPYTWAADTKLVPALQDPSGSGRIAAAWYASTRFTVDVDLTDGQAHNIELYLLDYDSTSRSEQIVFSDANTHAVLSIQTVSSFHTGVYLSWTISGNVLITITKKGGSNAVLSGLFFDPTTTGPAVVRAGNSTGGLVDATGVSSRLETDQIGTLDPSGDDPSGLSLVAEPLNPNGKLVRDLALEQVSIGQTRSRTRFGQEVVERMKHGSIRLS
jgi:Glycoside hydrolase family 44/Bacterial Ig-like domain (group 3)